MVVYDSNNNEYTVSGGVLTIVPGASGTGVMPVYSFSSTVRTLVGEDFTSVIIGSGMTNIGNYAFYNYASLNSVTIGNNVTSIGNNAFAFCTGLTSVTIPDSVTSIGDQAFYQCTSLTSVTIPDSVTSIGNHAFYQCTSLTSVTIPDSVTSIGINAFCYCTSLTSVIIGNSVTSIGNYAFRGCTSLTSVTIPNSVTSIGNYAFNGCASLTSVTVLGTTPASISSSVFPNNPTVINVPAGTLSAYQTAWSAYASQIQESQPDVGSVKVATISSTFTNAVVWVKTSSGWEPTYGVRVYDGTEWKYA